MWICQVPVDVGECARVRGCVDLEIALYPQHMCVTGVVDEGALTSADHLWGAT